MRPWRGTCGWCIGLVGVIAAAAFPAGAVQAAAISIAEARAAEPGTLVTVEGSVTVPSGRFSASTFDQGFAIQDGSAGIYVSVADDPKLNNHRRVRVTGVVGDDGYGQLVLRPGVDADVEILQGAARVAARQVATGDVGEATEGLLVEVTGSVVRGPTDDLPYGYSVYIDDGSGETQIFIPASTGINPFRIGYLDEGVAIRVTGLSSQFQNNLEVLPRTGGMRPTPPVLDVLWMFYDGRFAAVATTMQIWVDADACPGPIKEILFRAADKRGVQLTLVANHPMRVQKSAFIRLLQVEQGFDVVEGGGAALNPRGTLYTEENIREHLARRNFMEELRSTGQISGGPAALGKADVQKFANSLDRYLTRAVG
jgi:uncharacterized protein YaiI (UPF0178 family)